MTNRQLIEADLARLFPVRSEFDRQMEELRKEVTKFETAVNKSTQAMADFKAKI